MTRHLLALFAALLVTNLAIGAELPVAKGREFVLDHAGCKLFVPENYTPRDGGAVDLLVHFHGHPPVVRSNAEHAGLNAVILTINHNGLSAVYSKPFSDPKLFGEILDEALTTLMEKGNFDRDSHWDSICLSSFSAGYGAVREILRSPDYREQIAGILAADSLYASTAADGTPEDDQMVDYKTWADAAAKGDKTFLFSDSCVVTDGYESTRETGDELLAHLQLEPKPTDERGLGDLRFDRRASKGNFHYWGTPGSDANAHMAHLRYIGEFYQHLPLAKHASR
ncbi:hypothetical protein [Aeoliella sp. SH292]|uniref:hypothetical protein n=1 Tax=Aeoliella sp. SH292 TaxID=3454464 RepID=UPI003F9D3A50